MNFTEIFIRKPVLATVLSLVLLVLGLKALFDLQVRQYPEMETGVITIKTIYPGASASDIEGYVTQPIQQQVAQAEGIDYMYAQNNMGVSIITLYLKINYPTDSALAEVLSLVQQVSYRLPTGTQDPSITKSSSSPPIGYISFKSDRLENQQISDYISRVAVPLFSTVAGVNSVDIMGEKDFAMRIWLDPARMAAFSVDAKQVREAIADQNSVSSSGKFKGKFIEVDIKAMTDLKTAEEFGSIVLFSDNDRVVRISDVGTVELGASSYDESVAANGTPAIMVSISNTADSNPLQVIKGVYAVLKQIQEAVPGGMTVTMDYDSTIYISTSIDEVSRTLMEAIVIVILVVFSFLGSPRAVLIPVVTIPLSLIGSLFMMLALGFSINLLTLLAMVLAISLVVDDAIVVVENTSRHLEEGMDALQAAIVSAKEIAIPVISMTITLAAVYAPIGFMGGLTGSLFTEFAFSLAGAVLISGFIALTLTPMMCSRILTLEAVETPLVKRINSVLEALRKRYETLLSYLLANRFYVWPLAITILVSLVYMFTHTASELAPEEDQGVILFTATGPVYANTDYLQATAKPLEQKVNEVPETSAFFSVYGYQNDSTLFLVDVLTPWDDRTRTAQDIQHELQKAVISYPGLQTYTFSPPVLPGTPQGLPYQLVIKSATEDLESMYPYVEKLMERGRDSGKFIFIKNDMKMNRPQIEIAINRDKAASLGVSPQDIGTVLQTFLSEGFVNYFSLNGRSYQVIPEVRRDSRLDTAALKTYYVKASSGDMIPLSALVDATTVIKPSQNNQFQQLNSATIEAKMMPGVSLQEAHTYMVAQAKDILPDGYLLDSSGELRQFLQEGSSLITTFFLAIIIIYLVLAAQFESFRDPLIILTTVPLSIFGAMLPLYFGAATLNIYTEVGLVTLIGLISKHGILIVQFANDLQRDKGLNKHDAILAAAGVRLRPVLMTTAAMVIGVLPLVVATGAGANSRYSIGLVISVGMAVGTLFTLFVLPAIYTFLAEDIATEKPAEVQPHSGDAVSAGT